jgi:uncharacterized membrane protein
MIREEIEKLVLPKYKLIYPDWSNTRITEVVESFGGELVVVRGQPSEMSEGEEICYVSAEGGVTIFSTTEELARFLEHKANAGPLEKLLQRPVLSGLIFLVLLVCVFTVGFYREFLPQSLTILGSVTGMAAGFFFGANANPRI